MCMCTARARPPPLPPIRPPGKNRLNHHGEDPAAAGTASCPSARYFRPTMRRPQQIRATSGAGGEGAMAWTSMMRKSKHGEGGSMMNDENPKTGPALLFSSLSFCSGSRSPCYCLYFGCFCVTLFLILILVSNPARSTVALPTQSKPLMTHRTRRALSPRFLFF